MIKKAAILKLEQAIKSSGFRSEREKAVLNIMYTAYRVKTVISRVLKDYGLTPEQYNVLRILKGKYPEQMCVRDIAQRLVERSSNVPRIIDRLEVKKLVKRTQSDNDRRETVIILAQAGINLLESVSPVLGASMNEITLVSEGEAKQLNLLLDGFLKE